MQSCYNSWEEAGPCEGVSRLYNSVLVIIFLITSTHGFDAVFVITLLLAPDPKIVDPDGGVHSSHL